MRAGRLQIIAVAAASVAAAVGPSAAEAATRYADPAGSGTACTEAAPCSLQTAVEAPAVADGDEVILLAGDYTEASELTIDDAIVVAGSTGANRPLIDTTALTGVRVGDPGATLREVEIDTTGDAGLLVTAGVAEAVAVRGEGDAACSLGSLTAAPALIRNSTCWNDSPLSGRSAVSLGIEGAGTLSGSLRGVTAYATGLASFGVSASGAVGGDAQLDARNVVAAGTAADVQANADATSSATVVLTNSNYATESESGAGSRLVTNPGAGTNQTAEPALADPANGVFNQLFTSPTIDAGATDSQLGATDIDGEERVQGPAPDIGADEITDVFAPETSIASGPAAVSSEARQDFVFESSESNSTFECSIDGDDFSGCPSSYTTPHLAHGEHALRVRATDPAGNTDATPAERAFQLDRNIAGANASAKNPQRQSGTRILVRMKVKAGEPVEVEGNGRVRISKKRSYPIASKPVTLDTTGGHTLVLRTKASSANRKILKSLRAGKAKTATITATFTDDVGNSATTGDIEVKLTAKRKRPSK